jgi:protein-tyrosine phosphatase
MSAEYCLRGYLDKMGNKHVIVHSAGIVAHPESPHRTTLEMLQSFHLDASHHEQTKLSQDVLDNYDLVIAMALNHQTWIKEHFHRDVPLFNEIVIGKQTSVLDIEDVVPHPEETPDQEQQHIRWTVTYIHDHIPKIYEYIKESFNSSF